MSAGRLGTESEVSAAICFLLSPGAAFITGVTLAIDGGCAAGFRPVSPLRITSVRCPSTAFTARSRRCAEGVLRLPV